MVHAEVGQPAAVPLLVERRGGRQATCPLPRGCSSLSTTNMRRRVDPLQTEAMKSAEIDVQTGAQLVTELTEELQRFWLGRPATGSQEPVPLRAGR
jgi:hypothetical protein